MQKKLISLISTSFLAVIVMTTPVSAAQPNSTTNYLYNEKTGQGHFFNPATYTIKIHLDKDLSNQNANLDGTLGFVYQGALIRYDQSNASINWEHKKAGMVRLDNSDNPNPGHITFKATTSGTSTASGTVKSTTKGELDFMIAEVEESVEIGGTYSRSWTKGYEYGASQDVSPHKFGYLYGYVPATTTKGNAVYEMIQDSTGEVAYYKYVPKGAIVPSENAWNLKLVEKNS